MPEFKPFQVYRYIRSRSNRAAVSFLIAVKRQTDKFQVHYNVAFCVPGIDQFSRKTARDILGSVMSNGEFHPVPGFFQTFTFTTNNLTHLTGQVCLDLVQQINSYCQAFHVSKPEFGWVKPLLREWVARLNAKKFEIKSNPNVDEFVTRPIDLALEDPKKITGL